MHATRQAQYHQSCSGGDATRAWVAWLGGERKKLVFTHISSYVGGTSLLSTLNMENLRCGLECGYALPRLFSPSFFYAIYLNYFKNHLHFSRHFSSIAVVVFSINLIHICLFQVFLAFATALELAL